MSNSISMERRMLNRRLPRPSRTMVVGVSALLLMNVALSLALWSVWQMPLSRGELSQSPIQIPELATEIPRSSDGSLGEVVLARPVFEASRKPFVPPPPVAPAPPPAVVEVPPQPTPDLVVDGILLNGGVRKAHLRKRNELDGDWYAEGAIMEGWQITSISDVKVILTLGAQTIEARLYPIDTQYP